MPNGSAMAQGENGALALNARVREPGRQIPHTDREHAARQRPARGEHPEAEHDLPQAGQHPERIRREAIEHDSEQRTGDAGRNELLHRGIEHVVG